MPVFRTGPLPAGASTRGLSATVSDRGVLEGTATPGAVIEVNNLSVLPTGDGVVEDGVEVARAGADGRFTAQVTGASPGDVLQVQVRVPGQPVQTAVQLRVDAGRAQFDPRAAMVRVDRLRATAQADGTVVIAPRTRQPVTEPDATVRFQHRRSGAVVDVVADALGRFPQVRLTAAPGDVVDVAVGDGTGNLDFSQVAGSVDVVARGPLVQPAPLMKDRGFVKLLPLDGPLFLEGGPGSGRQGSIGNCPVPAACAALAAVDEAAVRDLIRDHGDGTFTVTFHPPGQKPVEIVIDHQVWATGQRVKYGTADADPRTGKIERWFPLAEKAYAAFVGDFEILGRGTSVGRVLAELTGRATREVWTNSTSVDDVWRELQRGAGNALPMAAGTWGTSSQETVDVGVFQMTVEDFCRLFQVLNVS